ncbi:MAG: acyltransferase family protein [Polaromonas sp.]|nr:acyltransferase family protein [Polaromonas sp.]
MSATPVVPVAPDTPNAPDAPTHSANLLVPATIPSRSQTARQPALDAIKAVACLTIVCHHLALYGPMSDVVQPHAPQLIGWLYDYGRMAVQVFLVLAGFLAAAGLAPGSPLHNPGGSAAAFAQPGRLLIKRCQRLVLPYLVALAFSVVVATLLRPWFAHDSLPGAAGWAQLLAHALLLQDVLGIEALSAGVWYVAIDLQLFALALLLLHTGRRSRRLTLALVAVVAAASLLLFNRHSALDASALYFFGSYALGLLAYWVVHAVRTGQRQAAGLTLLLMAGLIAAAMLVEFRLRIALAGITALCLVVLALRPPSASSVRWLQRVGLLKIGEMSYSIFLIHFPVVLLVSALVSRLWPVQPLANALGMLAALALSVLAGAVLWRLVESPRAFWRRRQEARAAAA